MKTLKKTLATVLAVVLLCGLMPTTALAAGWEDVPEGGIGFHYGNQFLCITVPDTEGYYTYGTAEGKTAAQIATDVATLPEDGWQWAVTKTADGLYMILNDFQVSHSVSGDGLMHNDHLTLELRGTNSITATSNFAATLLSGYWDYNLTIVGDGSLTLTGGSYGFNCDGDIHVKNGQITVSVRSMAVRAGRLNLGCGVTAKVGNNADGSSAVDFSGSASRKYLNIKPPVRIAGDANCDSDINVRDLGLFQQHLNDWDVSLFEPACDVNGDGDINVRDYGLLQQYLNDWDVTLK